jgi:hypothetical protein
MNCLGRIKEEVKYKDTQNRMEGIGDVWKKGRKEKHCSQTAH